MEESNRDFEGGREDRPDMRLGFSVILSEVEEIPRHDAVCAAGFLDSASLRSE